MAGLDIAKRSVRGSLILFIGNFGATAISAITLILIARLLGPTDYGVYSLALVTPGLLQLFLGLGVSTSVIRYAAFYNSSGKPDEARRFAINAIYFVLLTGVVLTCISFFLAGTLSSLLLHRSDLTGYVQLASLAILGYAALLTMTSATLGWSWMSLSSVSTVTQTVVKLALSPLLILAGLGITGALVGHLVSYIVAGVLGTSVFYFAKLRGSTGGGRFVGDVKEMLRFGLPLYTGGLISGLAVYYATIILASIANNTVFGYYQAASNFIAPITLVASALYNSLFPAFASVDGSGGSVQVAFKSAYKFVAFLLTPIIFFIVSTSSLLIQLFYGASYLGSVSYLELLALAYIPIAFGYSVHTAFFTGFGKPRLAMYVYLGGALTLLISAPLLAIEYGLGVDGLILANFLSYLAAWVVGTVLAKRNMNATLDMRANAAILLVSVISYLGTVLASGAHLSMALTFLLDLIVFLGLFLTLAPLSGAVNKVDVETMEYTFKDLRALNFIVGPLLWYERLVLSVRNRSTQDHRATNPPP